MSEPSPGPLPTTSTPAIGAWARPAPMLRAESAALLAVAVALYARLDASWLLFAILFLAPDLAALGLVAGPRAATIAYNAAHAAVLPGLLALVGLATDDETLLALALIWFAHLAFDRLVGYGLRYSMARKDSHLQRI